MTIFCFKEVPSSSVSRTVQTVKSMTAHEAFAHSPEVKIKLRGGSLWREGYFANTVGQQGSEAVIAAHVQRQGRKSYYRGQLDLELA